MSEMTSCFLAKSMCSFLMTARKLHFLSALVLTLLVTSCGKTGPVLEGRLIVMVNGVYEVSGKSTAATIDEMRILKPTDILLAVSPDRHHLAYKSDQDVMSYDLDTRESKHLFKAPDQLDCLTWSLDNSMLNYVSGPDAYVYEISRDAPTLIYTAPSARYSSDELQVQLGLGQVYHGQVACGDWFGPDRMLFRRYMGAMPSRFTNPGLFELAPNTTTLALVGDTVKLSDLTTRVNIRAVSTDGAFFLIDVFENEKSQTYLTRAFSDISAVRELDSIDARAISLSPDYLDFFLKFVPYSHDLFAFAIDQIYFINPASFQQLLGPKLDSNWVAWAWVGSPAKNIYAVAEPADAWRQIDIVLVDLDTGGRTLLMEIPNPYGGGVSADLIWLPPKEN